MMGVKGLRKAEYKEYMDIPEEKNPYGIYVGLALIYVFFELGASSPVFYDGIPVLSKFFMQSSQEGGIRKAKDVKFAEFFGEQG